MKSRTRALVVGGILVATVLVCYYSVVHFQWDNLGSQSNQYPISKNSLNDTIPDKDQQIRAITDIAQKEGVSAAYQYLKAGWDKKPLQAHDLAHLIGHLAYEQLHVGGIALCDTDFAFGCYHGFFEAMLKDQGESGIEVARHACIALSGEVSIQACLHGMGHGIMASKDSIPDSLARCSSFPSDERFSCFDGVFMEYNMGIMNEQQATVTPTLSDPWNFCETILSEAQPACIRNQTTYLLATHVIPQTSTIHACAALSGDEKKMCVNSIGAFAGDRRNESADDIKNFCGTLTDNGDYSYCVYSAISEMSFQSHDDHLAVMKELCSELGEQWKVRCDKLISL